MGYDLENACDGAFSVCGLYFLLVSGCIQLRASGFSRAHH
jgi:hypothetical protein